MAAADNARAYAAALWRLPEYKPLVCPCAAGNMNMQYVSAYDLHIARTELGLPNVVPAHKLTTSCNLCGLPRSWQADIFLFRYPFWQKSLGAGGIGQDDQYLLGVYEIHLCVGCMYQIPQAPRVFGRADHGLVRVLSRVATGSGYIECGGPVGYDRQCQGGHCRLLLRLLRWRGIPGDLVRIIGQLLPTEVFDFTPNMPWPSVPMRLCTCCLRGKLSTS